MDQPSSILTRWLAGASPTDADWQALMATELADQRRANAWGIRDDTVRSALRRRWHLLQQLALEHRQIPVPHGSLTDLLPWLWFLWLPLTLWLVEARQRLNRPLIQGILGGQGSGKTTLTRVLQQLLTLVGQHGVTLSIDDLYKTYADRQILRQQDPRLIWRGPPGTHDIELGLRTLQQLRQAPPDAAIPIPRFDKSAHGGEGDRISPEWVSQVDIVLFEGWFVGARPVDPAQIATAPWPIETEADRQFAADMNQRLRDYLPLWEQLDQLMVLYPEDYRLSQQWRRQAEQAMKADGKSGMADDTVDQFVEYFWRALHPALFIEPLCHRREWVDLVVEIRADRTLKAVYAP
ncbi:Uridine kinase [Halomicronema hongdechloris C2206]|uniref:Uridine kinase n=1 Tax=Halomicronema hongdechloris C2206 TaxID=1641165 RepID=A0A1Z3HQF0_9CYAN|nr:glycerate kinase [Halomicronema hongdechloris]ASC72544.1 Uridine kinase [Halomicronema hongdechloris C2206]